MGKIDRQFLPCRHDVVIPCKEIFCLKSCEHMPTQNSTATEMFQHFKSFYEFGADKKRASQQLKS